MLNLIVFCSGEGSSFMALDVLRNETSMPFSIKRVVCNNRNSLVNQYCQQPTAPTLDLILWDKENNTREEYEQVIYNTIKEHLSGIDYIFFLGWNFIVSSNFIEKIGIKILNLHPALPNKYVGPGDDCIENALKDSKFKGIEYTGSMVHEVTHLLDRGKVLDSIKVPIREIDTFTSLKNRIKSYEKKCN